MCKCETGNETTEQFLARCPRFTTPRASMLSIISRILNNDVSVLPDDHLTDTLLYGSKMYNEITNKLIIEAIIRFTKRFAVLEAFIRDEVL